MSTDIKALLVRNLFEVFDEQDSTRRKAAIALLFEEDCVFSDPRGRHIGHRALEEAVVSLHAQFPDCRFSQIGDADLLEDSGRLAWGHGPQDDPHRVTGLDVIVVNNSQIAALYAFLDPPKA